MCLASVRGTSTAAEAINQTIRNTVGKSDLYSDRQQLELLFTTVTDAAGRQTVAWGS